MKTNNIKAQETYKGYKLYVTLVENNLSLFWWDATNSSTYYNGYIVLPENSKFYGKHYDSINEEITVHEGFGFSEFIDNEYTIGFDTGHLNDDKTTQTVDFVLGELRKAVDQIIEKEKL